MASVIAVLPFLPAESAPASILSRIGDMIAGGSAWQVASETAAPVAKASGYLLKLAAAILFVAGVGVTLFFASRRGKEAVTSVPVPAAGKSVYYHWDFNTPGVPPELKCTMGSAKHVPNGGQDGKGCLEIAGPESRIWVDVAIDRFPVAVKWRGAWISFAPDKECSSKSFWFPLRDGATIANMGEWTTVTSDQGKGRWMESVNYHSGTYIDRWQDGARGDMTIGKPVIPGRLILSFISDFQIDDLTIASVSSNDLPDASMYLKAAERIPVDQDKGYIAVPELKPRNKDMPVGLYFSKGIIDEDSALGPAKGK
ncbi:MAG: hypothetical protein C0404_10625 [Verrucomicrobia bacterium]|nr:hypothetical protein [Verrucomicrobiota bacterium]